MTLEEWLALSAPGDIFVLTEHVEWESGRVELVHTDRAAFARRCRELRNVDGSYQYEVAVWRGGELIAEAEPVPDWDRLRLTLNLDLA